jgi:hypothetical protein
MNKMPSYSKLLAEHHSRKSRQAVKWKNKCIYWNNLLKEENMYAQFLSPRALTSSG